MLRTVFLFLAALLVALAVFVWTENEIAPEFQTCISQETSQNATKGPNNETKIIIVRAEAQTICSLRLIDRHNGFFSLLAAISIAWFTLMLAVIARRQALATFRPHLSVRNVWSPKAEIGKPIIIHFEVINNGQGDTKIIKSRFKAYFVGGGESYHTIDVPTVGDQNDVGGRLPMSAVRTATHTPGGNWEAAHMQEDRPPEQGYFWGGKILYLDGNGKNRRLGVFRRFEPSTKRFRSIKDDEYEYDD
jgi:hypothetical protein